MAVNSHYIHQQPVGRPAGVRLAVEVDQRTRRRRRRFKMDKGSSTEEEIQGDVLQISYCHSIFVEAFNALLRCLGLGTVDHQRITQESSTTSSSEQEDDGRAPEESPQYPPATRTSDPQADPPTDTSVISLPHSLSLSHTHGHLYEDPSTDAAARRTPPVSRGGGGQINSAAS
ncbi:hypothetical protein POTOM_058462 [Populus tomentosa]|uniref:Uncharacterized protein n=1 Tax=Populus tomentosa TaxID=118781 RepID=A0A8X7XV87_POPTO|nr:hypothetical protein POTOM_058462 [Populus tomentosa]